MPRCCVDIMRKVLATEAPDEKSTIAKAAENVQNPAGKTKQDRGHEARHKRKVKSGGLKYAMAVMRLGELVDVLG